ncbi:MAG: hypothetical protein R3217_01915 [Gammaproteobacteria bacterium]|nr:hypothetical protein [Gammaproteobacteria bacterium]
MPRINDLFPSVGTARLDHLRFFRISGADAVTFLQGQLSNDVAALDPGEVQLTSFNSPKGRVLAIGRLARIGDDYLLGIDAGIAEAAAKRLAMFILRSKVTLAPEESISGLVGFGDVDLPATDGCARFELPGPDGASTRTEVFGPADELSMVDCDIDADRLAELDILCKLPRITPDNQDQHVAQHLDLEHLGAINFKKGCYTGQEVIARMHYLGRKKTRVLVLLQSGAAESGEDSKLKVVNTAGKLRLAIEPKASEKTVFEIDGETCETLS